jgi:hypothetical protein
LAAVLLVPYRLADYVIGMQAYPLPARAASAAEKM